MEECQNCHLKFGTSTSLGSHIKKVHPGYTYVRKNLKCINCDYSAKSQTVINEHYKRCCKTEIQTCDLCEFRGSSYNLTIHMRKAHEESTASKLKCKECDYEEFSRYV